jgi:hypothetical protein
MLHRSNQREDHFYKKRYMERLVEINAGQSQLQIEQMIKKVDDIDRTNGETIRKNIISQVTQI